MLTRILLRLFFVAGLAVPLCTFALGVGPLEVRSSLNQAFEAEIPLIVSNPIELTGLTVRIPRQQDFDHIGVERLTLFSKLRFSVRASPGGPNTIRVTSLEPIREPNFNLLLELTWPRGRLIREFPVQLDPELYADRHPPPLPPPPVVVTPPVAVVPPPVKTVPVVPALPPAPPISFEGASFYGPVKPGETLAAIARRVRSSPTITAPQMMAILVAGNPEAFVNGNPNTLRAGATLKVPNPKALGISDTPAPSSLTTPELAAVSPPPPVPPAFTEPPTTPPLPAAPSVTEPAISLPPAVIATAPIPPAPEIGSAPSPVLSPTGQPQEIVPQASIPQPTTAPTTPAAPEPEPVTPPPPVAISPQPAPPPTATVKPLVPTPVADSEASWMDNPVVWVAIALIILAVGAVVLLPLLQRPARQKPVVAEPELASIPASADGSPISTTRTQARDPRSARSQPVAGMAAAMATLRGNETAPSDPQSTRIPSSEASPVSKPVATPAPKPIGELLKDMDFGLNTDQTVVASSKNAAHDLKVPSFDAEPPTASVTRRPINPLAAAPLGDSAQKSEGPPPFQMEELPSELRLDSLDFDFGDLGLENTARPQPIELPPLEMSQKAPNAQPAKRPPLGGGQKTPEPPLAKPALEDLKFEFTDVSLEHAKSSTPEESLRLDTALQDFGGDDALMLGKMAVEPSNRTESSTDYVETKLDLATAYLDMGDQVGARNLLDEVLQEGDAAQKQRAGELRKKLS